MRQVEEKKLYCSYDEYAVIYDLEENKFSVFTKYGCAVENGHIVLISRDKGKACSLETFKKHTYTRDAQTDKNVIKIEWSDSEVFDWPVSLEFKVDRSGILLTVFGLRENGSAVTGDIVYSPDSKNLFAVSLDRVGLDIRSGFGPACSAADDAVFNRENDTALCFDGGKNIRLRYDWDKEKYTFTMKTGIVEFQQRMKFSVKENVLEEKFDIEYSPINKKSTFSKPPAGWMTWYAVRFDACEEAVLKNALWQKENLKPYGADTIWVDWEWYHKDFKGERDDGVDTFNPDKQKYPHGLKHVAQEIEKMGLTPALWIGFTNDSAHNEYTKENPEIILADETGWCGRYFYDFSHPKYLNEFLPKATRQVHDWGYKAVKFDTLPIAIDHHEKYHMNMYDPAMSTKSAFRGAMKKTRECLGENMYMLSCAGGNDADFLWACDIFDAGRVGLDIFEWSDFLKEGVMCTLRYYSLNNMVLYTDPDNIVLREEFNTYDQARSRAFFTSLLGLPMNLGDDLPSLGKERAELLKQCLPTMDIHPMDLRKFEQKPDVLVVNLAIELPFESYNVVDVFNMTQDRASKKLFIDKDIHLDEGEYIVFDFNSKKMLGIVSDFVKISLEPSESRVLCIRKKSGIPQVISTSRHVSQGAAEIKALAWNKAEKIMKIVSEIPEGDRYDVYVYAPEGYEAKEVRGALAEKITDDVYKISAVSENGEVVVEIAF